MTEHEKTWLNAALEHLNNLDNNLGGDLQQEARRAIICIQKAINPKVC